MSSLEDDVAADLTEAGVPFHRQYRFANAIKRRWTFDFAIPSLMLAVEIEGGAYILGRHVRGAGFESDSTKYTYAELMGWHVFRFGPKACKAGIPARLIRLYSGRYQIQPAGWMSQVAGLIADCPKPPKKRSKRQATPEVA